ncbi:hypothetical protein PMNALOAF_1249 [Methylobacterium adhaesivum]|uniref:Head decoration protein n=1 Tax=Methylobacterium adhaesivum TaxID=333297 RepID=A0ABT8BGU8_9HYPH|nr:hypothetical protein [Methylobacterium adhaesivum]MDN3590606.1 hypothetical protein [Methylobacterium adhaesivum]GJD30006.1 hypothetical protein PMNALOAF_1249 [Methylobacterium adhaesivum]
MAIRKPLVLGDDGLPQVLQSPDTISVPTNAPSLRTTTNGESATTLPFGTPVYAATGTTVKRGQANAKATAKVVGLVFDASIAAGAAGSVAQSGILTGTTAQWDAVAGTTGGLAVGAYYFLDAANPGKLTATPPTTAGQVNVCIGSALSSTELEVDVELPILL